ncbi:alpha/beta-hydrolase [Exidia glandulosa HHB12029]|uniref:Alpha/beta-hydrolase n=1 Tax=Exidia glandulosa HHB12029 TaxID=1314781 RepID=A0A165KN00_EXIGL|nr:alpha/beta-hydrolase [Exidia glandulosa HHB12029]
MAQDVESLRLYLELDTIDHLAGHSNGGCIALWYAIRFPNRVRKLLLLDAQLLGTAHISEPAMAAVLDARPEKDKDAVAAFRGWRPLELRTDEEMAESLNAFLPLYLANPERDLAAFKAGFTNLPQAACITSQYAAEGQHEDQIDHLGEVLAETLIIVGRHDFICPVPVSERIAAGIRNSTLEVLEDCGHMPFIEKKEKFAEILRKLCSV